MLFFNMPTSLNDKIQFSRAREDPTVFSVRVCGSVLQTLIHFQTKNNMSFSSTFFRPFFLESIPVLKLKDQNG